MEIGHYICNKLSEFDKRVEMPETVHISTIPALVAQARWRLDMPHAADAHCYYWITRGQGRFQVEGVTRGFSPHTLLFVPANHVHALLPGALVQGYSVTFSPRATISAPEQPLRVRTNNILEQGEITAHLEQIVSEQRASNAGALAVMESHLTLLGIWVARRIERNDWGRADRPGAARRLLARFLRWLEANIDAKPTVAKAARALDVTPTHLSRVCQGHLGMPAAQIIRRRLVFAAMLALADQNTPIGRIATRLGFATPAYFSRVFSRVTGQSPKAFRGANRD